jgi:hypothetical protein
VLVTYAQQPQPVDPATSDDAFHDILDVAGVAVPLALAILITAVAWPGVRRWVRHRLRRRRRRHHHDAHFGNPRTP